jgi:hypothetical protein
MKIVSCCTAWLASNSRFSHLSLLSAGIIGVCHHTQLCGCLVMVIDTRPVLTRCRLLFTQLGFKDRWDHVTSMTQPQSRAGIISTGLARPTLFSLLSGPQPLGFTWEDTECLIYSSYCTHNCSSFFTWLTPKHPLGPGLHAHSSRKPSQTTSSIGMSPPWCS